jgi:ribosomal protein S12 methylthiotransferase
LSAEITKLARNPKNPDAVTVEFDGGEKLTVTGALVADYSLYTGRALSTAEYEALRQDASLAAAKARALRILGKRQMSRREITERLVQKGESEETAQDVTDWLVQIGAVNDAEYAAAIVRHYASGGYGLMRIRDELYRHGIARELWEDALAQAPDMEEAAWRALASKLRGKKPDKAELGRVTAGLYRRGFSWGEVQSAAERYKTLRIMIRMNKVGLISLGCAKNLVNSEQMLCLLSQAGYEITEDLSGADAVVVNTCAFIETAKTEAIDTILELAEAKNAGNIKKIIVAGCLPERYKDEIQKELPEIDAVVGVGSFHEIVGAVETALAGESCARFGDVNAPEPELGRLVTTPPAWAYLKLAEGCDNRCAYCVIPAIRGRYRSRTMENALAEAEALVASGARELILIAQDTTRYGLDLYGEKMLPELLRRLCRIGGLRWIRLHYLYPDEIDDRLIDVVAGEEKVLKYLDIPIQHISDGILKRMRRRGTGGEIRALLEKLRTRVPGVVLRTSLITGLPGEGEREFAELTEFLKKAKIERAGVFAYSPEEGTPAAEMARPEADTARARADAVMALQSGIMDAFNKSRLGSVPTVLVEGFDGEHWYGRSFAESPEIDGYIRFDGEDVEPGTFCRVLITGISDGEPFGVLEK